MVFYILMDILKIGCMDIMLVEKCIQIEKGHTMLSMYLTLLKTFEEKCLNNRYRFFLT